MRTVGMSLQMDKISHWNEPTEDAEFLDKIPALSMTDSFSPHLGFSYFGEGMNNNTVPCSLNHVEALGTHCRSVVLNHNSNPTI